MTESKKSRSGEAKSLQELRNKEQSDMDRMPALGSDNNTDLSQLGRDPLEMILNPAVFEHLYRQASALARTSLIPKAFQGKPDDCFVATQMAVALRCQPMQVLQNTHVINGTPGFSAKFAIALANKNGPFRGVIKFKTNGKPESDPNFGVTAYATLRETNEVIEKTVTMKTAKGEGWDKNPKYQSMAEQMLSYRAAMFLIRLTCPEVLFGMNSVEEVEDILYSGREVIDGEVSYPEPDRSKPAPEKNPSLEDQRQSHANDRETDAHTTATEATQEETAAPEGEPPATNEEAEIDPEYKGPSFGEIMGLIMKADKNEQADYDTLADMIRTFPGARQREQLHTSLDNKFQRSRPVQTSALE